MSINDFHVGVGYLHEGLLHGKANHTYGVTLTGGLQAYTGCSMGNGYRRSIPPATSAQATRKLKRVFPGLSGHKAVAGRGGFHFTMAIRDDLTRYAGVYFVKHKPDTAEGSEQFLPDARGLGKVDTVRSDDGGAFTSRSFIRVCSSQGIKRELTTADNSAYKGAATGALGYMKRAFLASRSGLISCTQT